MATACATSDIGRIDCSRSDRNLAASITRTASKQTYYTVRLFVDQGMVDDAYRAYAYFRWVDDTLDQGGLSEPQRLAFVARQQVLIERCYRGDWPRHLADEERMLVDLIADDAENGSGLRAYIRNMMAVMAFDAGRRGRLISAEELNSYTRWLATAVTEAMHHFIGQRCRSPHDETRHLAVIGAHITHMLRDTLEDAEAGYYNIPREVVEAYGIDPCDVGSPAYRAWVMSRVTLARDCFRAGRDYLARVESLRCRIAGYAYMARFESVLDAIERDGYRLRASYPECKALRAGVRMGWSVLSQALIRQRPTNRVRALPAGQG
jgi:phytoene/squalene synthetase